jgi:two-component sensor histidine kinase/ligand-binding sensor domain-containing protein
LYFRQTSLASSTQVKSNHLTFRIFLFILAQIAIQQSRAQIYDFVTYSVENGLSQSSVTSTVQDERGYLWVGTYGGGLGRFDGLNFREYALKDGLPGQIVSALAKDSAGNLWVGTTWGGVSWFDGKQFHTYNKTNGLSTNEISSLMATSNGMWIGTPKGGIYEYALNTKVFRRFSMLTGVNCMYRDNNGIIWASCDEGITRFENEKHLLIDLPKTINFKLEINQIISDRSGVLYIAHSKGLLAYDPSKNAFLENELTKATTDFAINTILVTRENTILLGFQNGVLWRYFPESSRIEKIGTTNGLVSGGIKSLYQDQTGQVWIGTLGHGLIRWRTESFTYYENIIGLKEADVFRIVQDHEGKIWIGSGTEGLFVYDGQQSKAILNAGKKFMQPIAILEDHDRHLWIGHMDGVTELIGDIHARHLLPGKRVRALYEDKAGNLWIGTWVDGLYKYDGKTYTHYTEKEYKIPIDYIHAILEDQKGMMWFGTGSGLIRFDGTYFKSYAKDLCNTYVGSLFEDENGRIWLHTDQCIMHFDGNKFVSITEKDGLSSNTIYFVGTDQRHRIWAGSNKGLDRIELNPDYSIRQIRNYGYGDGFRGIECNSRAICCDSRGDLWFGTIKGVIRYTPSQDKFNTSEPSTFVTDIHLFLEPTVWPAGSDGQLNWFSLPDRIELPHDKNHLTFHYAGLHLSSPEHVLYQFQLCGFDSGWQPATKTTQITYSNIPPGTYRFQVKAANSEGIWNVQPALSPELVILSPPPPFWKTWWFYSLVALLIIAVLYYFIFVRTRILRRQRENLELQIVERTQEIRKQNEEKSLMLKEIHHRVKNNLQVISSLLNLQAEGITDKRVLTLFEDCRHRVNSMALIHQKMYQSHNLVNIDIGSYIDELIGSLIDTYDTDKKIDLHTDVEELPFRIDTIVPLGLILNEIISNALKYAFKGKKEGRIHVQLYKTQDNTYMLEAGDNGVGLPQTIQFEKANSLGMQLIMMLAEQLNGRVQLIRSVGTIYRISFKEDTKDRF